MKLEEVENIQYQITMQSVREEIEKRYEGFTFNEGAYQYLNYHHHARIFSVSKKDFFINKAKEDMAFLNIECLKAINKNLN